MAAPEITMTTSKPPRDRIRELDLARGLAIVAMVITHSLSFTGSDNVVHSTPFKLVNMIVSILAAPVFMSIMGVLQGYSSRTRTGKDIIRGIMIIGLGYALNFSRGTLPVLVGLWIGSISTADLDHGPWYYMLDVDILQFAGLAIIGLSIIRRLMPWPAAWCALGAIILFGSPFLLNIESAHPILRYAISQVTGNQEFAFFPLFPWMTFPLFGMAYGALLKRTGNRQGFFRKSALVGSVLFVIGLGTMGIADRTHLSDFLSGSYRHGQLPPIILLTFIGFQGMLLPLCRAITERFPRFFMLSLLYHWSKNVTVYYCIQWILIGWICIFLPPLEWIPVLCLIVVVLFLTDRILISLARKNLQTETV
jgi:uncharacterized membrane protein